jgi:hypothetical protein
VLSGYGCLGRSTRPFGAPCSRHVTLADPPENRWHVGYLYLPVSLVMRVDLWTLLLALL